MTHEEILRELLSLPPEAQRQVVDYILVLRQQCAGRKQPDEKKQTELRSEAFVGMWRDREDLQNSSAWVREHRTSEWVK